MFLEAMTKPDREIERLNGSDYYRVTRREDFDTPSTVISGIVRGVTFSFDIPGTLGAEETRALVALVAKGVEENVFLPAGVAPGVDRIGLSSRLRPAVPE